MPSQFDFVWVGLNDVDGRTKAESMRWMVLVTQMVYAKVQLKDQAWLSQSMMMFSASLPEAASQSRQ